MKAENARFRLFPLLLVLLAALIFFPLLYAANNKYYHNGPQPIAGLLCVSEQDLAETPLRFLVNEWAFYPDILLSPDDFSEKAPSQYLRYVAIGQYGGMELGDPRHSPHGSGTYALELLLPETPRVYAIELPVIYSAYRFYVDGQLAQQMGEPEPSRFRAALQSKTVTFSKGGHVRLLLAVTDQEGIYSGMVSPPAFGTPDAVCAMRELRIFVTALPLALSGGALLAALYFATRLGYKELWAFAILCACLIGNATHPLLYTYFPIPRAYFALRFLSLYAVYPLILLLHQSFCGIEKDAGKIPLAAAFGFLCCMLFYGVAGGKLEYPLLQLFSVIIQLFKWIFAAYLLVTAAIALKNGRGFAGPQLLTTVFFASSLVADRALPLYEPILGGWFTEVGEIALIAATGCFLGIELADAYRFRHTFEQERRLMERQLHMQKEHFSQLSGKIDETRRLLHDFRHHLRIIRSFAQKGNLEGLSGYVDHIIRQSLPSDGLTMCAHPAADVLLQYYSAAALQQQSDFQSKISLPPDLPFPDTDLCILLGNLLENALEACMRQKTGQRFIRVRGTGDQGKFILIIENSYNGESHMARRHFLSSKHEGMGIGTESVREVVKRHGGIVRFLPREHSFLCQIFIPLTVGKEARPDLLPPQN